MDGGILLNFVLIKYIIISLDGEGLKVGGERVEGIIVYIKLLLLLFAISQSFQTEVADAQTPCATNIKCVKVWQKKKEGGGRGCAYIHNNYYYTPQSPKYK